jgi:hypothetical protein
MVLLITTYSMYDHSLVNARVYQIFFQIIKIKVIIEYLKGSENY